MFHVEQRAVEYVFHVERGARCGENLRRRFNCNEINLPIDVATRRSRALVHKRTGVYCTGASQLLLREPWWIIVSAEPASRWRVFHVEHRGW